MPLFYFYCPTCRVGIKKLLSPAQAKESIVCKECKDFLIRTPKNPAAISKETIDNGLMAKKVEQYADSAELIQERSDTAKNLKNKPDL